MPLVQVRDVSDATVRALKARAAESGQTLSGYLRSEFDRMASRPSNARVAERLAARRRQGGPTVTDTVAEIRRAREPS